MLGRGGFRHFDFRMKLGGGATVFGQIEMWVVAEAVGACGLPAIARARCLLR